MSMDEIDYSIQYRKWHDDSIRHYEDSYNYYKRIFSNLLPEDKDIKILDVGCGFGLAIYSLKKMGYKHVKGIDISRQLVEVCHKNNLDVELVEDSTEWLNKHPCEFDVIIFLDVLEHIPPEKHLIFLKSIYKSLKQNGMIICTTPNANSTFSSRWIYNDWTHYTSFTEHSLDFILRNSGFKDVQIKEVEFITKPRYPIILRKSVLHWILFKIIRFFRRLEAIAELGEEGKTIPLSLNLLAVAYKKDD